MPEEVNVKFGGRKMGCLELKPGGLSYGSKLGESCNRTLFDYITTIHDVQQINLITFFELEQTMGYLILHGFQGPKELCWEKYNVNSVCVCVCMHHSDSYIVFYSM